MKLYSWNVNGIRAVIRKGDFGSFVDNHRPDVLCLQETKAAVGQVEVDLPGYEEFWNSAERKGYSGTAVFSREKPVSVLNDFVDGISAEFGLSADEYGDPMTEGRVLTVEYEQLYVVTAYVPNAKRDLSRLSLREKRWDPAMLAHLKELERRKPVVFCGDLNVAHTEDDLANPKANRGEHGFTDEERAGFRRFLEAGFTDTFREFTGGNGHYSWWSYMSRARERNAGWRIDYFLISERLRPALTGAGIHTDVFGSDHCPVSIELDLARV